MKKIVLMAISVIIILSSCNSEKQSPDVRIIFLHHSTGNNVWNGNPAQRDNTSGKATRKIFGKLNDHSLVSELFRDYNKKQNRMYSVEERNFPARKPYGWKNYPFDYYNVWVKNAGDRPFMGEPTLEMLTRDYQIVVFKHCFPVSNIKPDEDAADINSEHKSLANYKLQYLALRDKLLQFPQTKFIVWTGAAQVRSNISEEEARRSREFFTWVVSEWDLPEDNIHVWDFYNLQTEGGFYFKDEFAQGTDNSHPNPSFSEYAAGLFFNRIIDVAENNGTETTLAGLSK